MLSTPASSDSSVPTNDDASLMQLLTAVNDLLECDHEEAKLYLSRATALLRSGPVRRSTSKTATFRGGLAPWQSARISNYIDENLDSRIQAGELASMARLSLSHFFRAFKVTYGVPPCNFVARRRIDLAKRLMQGSREPLAKIALHCGMCDQAHFTRVFRRVSGMSPSLWRRQFVDGSSHSKGVTAFQSV